MARSGLLWETQPGMGIRPPEPAPGALAVVQRAYHRVEPCRYPANSSSALSGWWFSGWWLRGWRGWRRSETGELSQMHHKNEASGSLLYGPGCAFYKSVGAYRSPTP